MAAFLLAALLQDPLASDDIAVREAASRELLAQGESALPSLRERLAAASDPELRARLGDVVRGLEADQRRRLFGGGKDVAGLRARLRAVESPAAGRLPFRLEIMNIDPAPRPFIAPKIFNVSRPGLSSRSSAAHGEVRITLVEGVRPTGLRGRHACGSGPGGTVVPLRPGESKSVDAFQDPELPPGVYEVKVIYFAQRLLGAPEDLESDVLRFEVR